MINLDVGLQRSSLVDLVKNEDDLATEEFLFDENEGSLARKLRLRRIILEDGFRSVELCLCISF